MNDRRNTKWYWIIPPLVIVFFVILSLLRHFEPGGECWGYWYFSRVLIETGEFIVLDRSPLYTVYLTLFHWLGYPTSVTLEYVVTTSFAALSLFFFLKPYLRLPLAIIAVLLWIPTLYGAVPPVQAMALGCCCLAMIARRKWAGRKGKSVSYALFGAAYLFRGVYLLFLLAFIAWDFVKVMRERGWKGLRSSVRPRLHDSPIFIVIMLLILFAANQSSHPWNTVFVATAKYFPCNAKSLVDASVIQTYNWEYCEITYGASDAKDFYFTNQEVFNGATTALGAMKENPEFIIKQWGEHAKSLLWCTVNMTSIDILWQSVVRFFKFAPHFGLLVLLIIYGAIRQSINRKEWIFTLCCLLALIPHVILGSPKVRLMVAFIPVLIVGASWLTDTTDKYLKVFGAKLKSLLSRSKQKPDHINTSFRMPVWTGFIIGFIMLLFVSNVAPGWGWNWTDLSRNLVSDVRQGDVRILDRRDDMKQSFSEIESIIADCQGVMALEVKFLGAFSNLPREKFYDIWEIPPYGTLNNSDYSGLRPERIDCLLISKGLQTRTGLGTNISVRYQNYIKPYMDELLRMGALSIEIPGYGRAVILKSSKN